MRLYSHGFDRKGSNVGGVIMKIQWFGHSFFLVTSQGGKKIVFDPFDQSVGYPLPQVSANMVCVSHSHYDHNNVQIIGGNPEIIQKAGIYVRDGYQIQGFQNYHDHKKGKERGENVVYRIEIDGLSLIHAGDMGMLPSLEEIESWKPLDILLVPVGGIYTINGHEAQTLVEHLKPRVVIPMHYRTPLLKFELQPVENFTYQFFKVKTLSETQVEITRENLPESTEIWIFPIPK